MSQLFSWSEKKTEPNDLAWWLRKYWEISRNQVLGCMSETFERSDVHNLYLGQGFIKLFPKMDFGGSRNGAVRLLWLLRARLLRLGRSGWPQLRAVWKLQILRHLWKHKASQLLFWKLQVLTRSLNHFQASFGSFAMIPSRSFQPQRRAKKKATRFYLAAQPAFTRGCPLYRGDASAMMLGLSLERFLGGRAAKSLLYHDDHDVFHWFCPNKIQIWIIFLGVCWHRPWDVSWRLLIAKAEV